MCILQQSEDGRIEVQLQLSEDKLSKVENRMQLEVQMEVGRIKVQLQLSEDGRIKVDNRMQLEVQLEVQLEL